jgi:hypothetical protein
MPRAIEILDVILRCLEHWRDHRHRGHRLMSSFLVLHRALPDLQRMKHKPDQALGHREVFCFFLVFFLFRAVAWVENTTSDNCAGPRIPRMVWPHVMFARARMRRGANSVTSAVPDRADAADAGAGGFQNDPKPGKNRKQQTADAPCFQGVFSLFSLCYLLLEKLSKFLIPLSDCPFVLNRLPVFLGKYPCFREKNRECGFTPFWLLCPMAEIRSMTRRIKKRYGVGTLLIEDSPISKGLIQSLEESSINVTAYEPETDTSRRCRERPLARAVPVAHRRRRPRCHHRSPRRRPPDSPHPRLPPAPRDKERDLASLKFESEHTPETPPDDVASGRLLEPSR